MNKSRISNLRKTIMKKEIIELYIENISFTIISLTTIYKKYVLEDREADPLIYISFILSIISSVSVLIIYILELIKIL